MASAGMDDDVDYYALLEVTDDATLDQIRTAYRKKSLKVHPDRNPNNPEAAAKFHELNQASQILLDPIQRSTFDKLRQARLAHKQRFAALDSKRKAMQEELEQSEREWKRKRQEQREQGTELERLKEEGRRLREQARLKSTNGSAMSDKFRNDKIDELKEEARRKREAAGAASHDGSGSDDVIELGPLDTTLKLRWTKTSSVRDKSDLESRIRQLVEPQRIDIDVVLAADKIPKGRASVKFSTLSSAVKVLKAVSDEERIRNSNWTGLEAVWAAGKPPAAVANHQQANASGQGRISPSPESAPMPSIPAEMLVNNPDEDSILAQLRARERQKLMAELEEQDARDEQAAAAAGA
ncbi:hypothetical protein OIV83_004377 [Microbotryomycetes sp. JL201]|nr:hypothetical protein OIV83_004377 [Microbotryomycetes sp. JL201]